MGFGQRTLQVVFRRFRSTLRPAYEASTQYTMANDSQEKLLEKIKEQGDIVRNAKAAKADKSKVIFIFIFYLLFYKYAAADYSVRFHVL